jgi:hypothetical protein
MIFKMVQLMKKVYIASIILAATFVMIFSGGCFKDNVENKPTVITSSITDISSTSANGGGNIINDQGEPTVARGLCWSTESEPTILDASTNVGGSMWEFTSTMTGLTPNTKYYVRAYATLRQLGDEVGTGYGNQVVFTTLP